MTLHGSFGVYKCEVFKINIVESLKTRGVFQQNYQKPTHIENKVN